MDNITSGRNSQMLLKQYSAKMSDASWWLGTGVPDICTDFIHSMEAQIVSVLASDHCLFRTGNLFMHGSCDI
jgi:hypothetical protein